MRTRLALGAWWSVLALLAAWGVVRPLLPAAPTLPTPAPVPAASRAATPVMATASQAASPSLPPGTRFRDCPDDTLCPWLRVLPAGSFLMGSPKGERGRMDDEDPQHKVTLAQGFALMEAEVTRGQFARFVQETSYKTDGGCYTLDKSGSWQQNANRSWRDPGFAQTDAHPVVCVNWNDAQAYAKWLAGKTGQTYRLPSEAEWEYAARAATTSRWSFGEDDNALCGYANVADQTARRELGNITKGWTIANCPDGHTYTAPGKTYKPNAWGLYDMHGNAWEWVADCWHQNYQNAPTDGSEWRTNCDKDGRRVLRGGGWNYDPQDTRSAFRNGSAPGNRGDVTGFRLARTLLGPKAEGPLPNASSASK